jgi:hypothetical protein
VHDAADHPTVINSRYASRICRQQRLQPAELLITQPERLAHQQASSMEALNQISADLHTNFMGLEFRMRCHSKINSQMDEPTFEFKTSYEILGISEMFPENRTLTNLHFKFPHSTTNQLLQALSRFFRHLLLT